MILFLRRQTDSLRLGPDQTGQTRQLPSPSTRLDRLSYSLTLGWTRPLKGLLD